MRTTRSIAAAMLLFAAHQAGAASGTTSTYSVTVPPDASQNLTLTRWYKLYVPSPVASPAPLVIVLHGGGEDYDQIINPLYNNPTQVWAVKPYAHWQDGANNQSIADRAGLVVAVPNGIDPASIDSTTGNAGGARYGTNQYWNDCSGLRTGFDKDGTNPDGSTHYKYTVDDVAFIAAMIADIRGRVAIDASRIYVAGASDGGKMTLRLARELPGTFAAAGASLAADSAGPYASPTPDPLLLRDVCANGASQAAPVPLWMVKGDQDAIQPYNGGCNSSGSIGAGCWLPYDPAPTSGGNAPSAGVTTIGRILARYGLATAPTGPGPIYYNAADTGDNGSTVACTCYYGSGTAGVRSRSDLQHCTALGAGHIDPSITVHDSATIQLVLGNQNYDIETAVEEWQFFSNYTNPTPP